jgi:mRNA-degrading endonuclease RelE of RelBE toxin-antitoxin system
MKYSKKSTKYYLKTSGKTRKRIDKMLEDLKTLDGDIEYIKQHGYYRIKIEHYRAIFTI